MPTPHIRAFRLLTLTALCLWLTLPAASAETLTVAAASDLQPVLPALAAQFEKETGHTVTLSFGSSGNFFTQIQNGAPYDVFLSADIDYQHQLERASLTERDSLYRYAIGRIVLWTRNDSGIDLRRGLAMLTDPNVRHIAIANPEHAPYGRAAVAALNHERLYDRIKAKLVLGENISQAAQFVQSGNAEVGIVALSLALAPALEANGTFVTIPDSFYPPIEQAAVILSASPRKATARQFMAFLKRPESERTLQTHGFARPEAPGR